LAAIALVYALLAGLHTIQDFDLPWQLATGRWIVQHHQTFSADIFSYTAPGAPWIYPVLSGIIFYLTYLAGGYALLSWLGAITCAGTVGLLLRRNNIATAALAFIAVPLIANRTQPRAEMFTTLLFAAYLSILWNHYRTGQDAQRRSLLWLLPVLMIFWVNLHPGFAAGLALCAVYILLEVLDLPFTENRRAVRSRFGRAWPWLALTVIATIVNPWGFNIYKVLTRQQEAQSLHNQWVVEWEGVRPSWNSLRQAIHWRDPQSAFWWLMAIALVCAAIALWRRHWGSSALLLASLYLAIQHVRLEALFACVTVILGGTLLNDAFKIRLAPQPEKSRKKNAVQKPAPAQYVRTIPAALLLLTAVLTTLAAIRCRDLVTNRYYLRSTQLSLFGPGISWWFPERALAFVKREKLPGNIFNTYGLGGYLTWRLFPEYRDYIDSRALPFGSDLFFQAYQLTTQPPESPVWQQEADARNIDTIVVPIASYDGIALFPQLRAFCSSQLWRPVYLDEVSVVFLRRTPQTAALVDRLQIDCDKVSFTPPPQLRAAELFNFSANSAEILYTLGRYPDAFAQLDRAQSIFSDNAHLHLLRGLMLQHTGHAAEAETELRASLTLEPNDEAELVLGLLYMTQARYTDAIELFRQAAESSNRPHHLWMLLGQAYLQVNQPQPALEAFDKAEAASPFHNGGESLGASFNSMVATGRAKAAYQLGNLAQAVSFQEDAVRLAPNDPKLWSGLADLYEAEGRTAQAAQARSHSMASQ
jgi:tetratricopeptide (TPR) repeat protein